MNLDLPIEAAVGYKNRSQIARVLTEGWTQKNMYCPACTSNYLVSAKPGTETVDFICYDCNAAFQLKAKRKSIGHKIVDAAYDPMIRAILEDRLPHLFLLSYCYTRAIVKDLLLIPKFCIPKSSIEKRKPLGPKARRAGWVGCNILIDLVPPEARINIIRSSNIIPKSKVRASFHSLQPLQDLSTKTRGWTLDLLTVLRTLDKQQFTINDAYSFEKTLFQRHTENRHIKPKIRQQLQILRDMGYLQFIGRGHYRWLKK